MKVQNGTKLTPLVESPMPAYLIGVGIGIGCGALVLMFLLGAIGG